VFNRLIYLLIYFLFKYYFTYFFFFFFIWNKFIFVNINLVLASFQYISLSLQPISFRFQNFVNASYSIFRMFLNYYFLHSLYQYSSTVLHWFIPLCSPLPFSNLVSRIEMYSSILFTFCSTLLKFFDSLFTSPLEDMREVN